MILATVARIPRGIPPAIPQIDEWMNEMPVRMDRIRDHRGVWVRITRDAFAGEPLRFHCKCGWFLQGADSGTLEQYTEGSQMWRTHVETKCKARVAA